MPSCSSDVPAHRTDHDHDAVGSRRIPRGLASWARALAATTVLLAVAALAGCAGEVAPASVSEVESWEDFRDRTRRISDGEVVHVVEEDLHFDEEELRAYYEESFTAAADSAVGLAVEPLYYLSGRIWPGPDITVCWESDGFETEKAWVQEVMTGPRSWSEFADIRFTGWERCDAETRGIRITVGDDMAVVGGLGRRSDGSSRMELDFTSSPQTRYAACVAGSLSRRACIEAAAIHEFGHSLGFAHEQRRRDTPPSCTTGVSSGSRGDTTYGDWDLASIMNACSVSTDLSITDLRGVGHVYGRVPVEIMRYTGSSWETLDRNPMTKRIAADGVRLVQLHRDGAIWRFTGTACTSTACTGWEQLDYNRASVEIAVTPSDLYQRHSNGSVWRYTGTPCSGGYCPGWQQLSNDTGTIAITASGLRLYRLRRDGSIFEHTGVPCSGSTCSGWRLLDRNPRARMILAAGPHLYQLHDDGSLFRYTGLPCSGSVCAGWQQLDDDPNTESIAGAGTNLYQLHSTGLIWRYTGTPCSGGSCSGWQLLDVNARTTDITAHGRALHQRHSNGSVWTFTGTACSGVVCPGWSRIDATTRTRVIEAGNSLFTLRADRL